MSNIGWNEVVGVVVAAAHRAKGKRLCVTATSGPVGTTIRDIGEQRTRDLAPQQHHPQYEPDVNDYCQ